MIRKHTRFVPHLDQSDILFSWPSACKVGSKLALLAEQLSRQDQFPAAELAIGMSEVFDGCNYIVEFSSETMINFTRASRDAYRTEHSVWFVKTKINTTQTERQTVHVFLKFFKKRLREPFRTAQVVIGKDGNVMSFSCI